MAKRFGRNQKRAMRQQIADLERQVEQHCGSYQYYKSAVEYAEEVLGRYTAALPPKDIEHRVDQGRSIDMPFGALREFNLDQAAVVTKAVQRIEMGIYRTDVQFDGLRNEMHAVVRMPSGRAYAATMMLKFKVPPKVIAQQLASALEPGVSKELRGAHV